MEDLKKKDGRFFATHSFTNSSKDRRSLTTRKSILFFDFLLQQKVNVDWTRVVPVDEKMTTPSHHYVQSGFQNYLPISSSSVVSTKVLFSYNIKFEPNEVLFFICQFTVFCLVIGGSCLLLLAIQPKINTGKKGLQSVEIL